MTTTSTGCAAPSFPATSPNVVAVGGTALRKASGGRGWAEEVWNEPERELGSGSGCSLYEAKPAWQSDGACHKRIDNDVSADAACVTPLSVYSTPYGGWEDFCGTSASPPLFAGIEAHASERVRTLGRKTSTHSGRSFDVTAGGNGTCTPPAEDEYFSHGEPGYDGPTGLGTPDGVPVVPPPVLTAVEPNAGPAAGGTAVTISGRASTKSAPCDSVASRPRASRWNRRPRSPPWRRPGLARWT